MVHLDRVERRFGARVLFRDLSWLIPRGARFGLVGPNGTGKTTLLRIVAGHDPPDAGAVHRPSVVRIGYLPQEVETVSGGSVREVVLAGAEQAVELAERIERLGRELEESRPEDPRTAELAARYGEARHRFEALGGDQLEARAEAILSGLGVERRAFDRPLEELSGGWRMRVVLARLLLGAPELLLLDEPTNHLDLDALDWLEGYLEDYPGAFVVVSHDRYFLNRVVRGIVELDLGRLRYHPGDYDAFLDARSERRAALEQAAREQAREIARVERFVERFRYKATKARQVQSRVRALDKLARVRTETVAATIRFGFPVAPRSGDVVARLSGVVKRFGERVVCAGVDLTLVRGDRLAVVGPNGAGKSTLLKLLAGRLGVDDGRVELGHNVCLQHYGQHQLEELDPGRTVLEEIERVAEVGERPRLRRMLGCFLFRGDDVDKRVAVLSGGEKARLALARMLVRPSNLLLLDEPTNHLDLASREVLEEALNEYDGTLVVVSHDRYLINRVATSVAEIGGGRLERHAGDYDEYLARKAAAAASTAAADEEAETDATPRARQLRQVDRRRAAEERNRRYRARRAIEQRLEPIEARVAELERRLGLVRDQLADPLTYRDPQRAGVAGRERIELERELAELYQRWEAIAAELERG